MAQLLNIAFKKNDLYTSWGFQVCGGRDSWRPLAVRNVQNGTLACNYLNVGDRILEIDGIDCYSLTESQAVSFLRRPSNSIELLVLKRRGENVVPPKRSSSCKAFQNFAFPKPRTAEPDSAPGLRLQTVDDEPPERRPAGDDAAAEPVYKYRYCTDGPGSQFSNFRPRRNSLQQTDGEPVCLRSRSSSPQFWKLNAEGPAVNGTLAAGADCRSFWKRMEKCSMEDLSARHTPSPVRPASVAFYPKTPESKTGAFSPKKKVTFSNVLLERNYLQMELPDLSPGSKVDEEFNKIYNSSSNHEQHQIGTKNLAGDAMQSAPPPPAPPPPPPLHSGGIVQGGPPPPPPPMLHSGHIPAIRIKTQLDEPREIPSTIQNAMATKDKKPFTYLPGGLDLSEIRSPRMQRRLERNAQTPPSPEQVPQKSPEYQPQLQAQKPNFEPPKPVCNVRPASERVCLLPQVQHQPQLNKAPTPWMQKAAQVQPSPAPWAQNKNGHAEQVDTSEEKFVPVKVETIRQTPSQPLQKNNVNHSYEPEPIQGRSFKVLQQITEPKNVYDGSQTYNSQSLPLSELRKLQLSDDDRSFMNKVKSQANMDEENPRYRGGSIPSKLFRVLDNSVDDDKFLHNETDPRYRGASIPSRSFRMLQTLTNSAPVPVQDNHVQSVPVQHYVSVEPIGSKIYVPPSERPTGMEPHKYTGGSIPSRSFRMLQAMTGQNNEEEEEYDSQNKSLTPYPITCPEFWQHYKYLKEFHDQHTGADCLHQKFQRLQQEQQQQDQQQFQQQQRQQTEQQQQNEDVVYTAHALNTIDEEECSEEDKPCNDVASAVRVMTDGRETSWSCCDTECEVTVTITLPSKKPASSVAEGAGEETTGGSPVDFWLQINGSGKRAESASAGGQSSKNSEREAAVPEKSATAPENSGSDTPGYVTATPATPRATACSLDVSSRQRSCEEDADSGITTLSADVSPLASEKDANGGGGGGSKKYQRTCTHSRLFDFLLLDDRSDGGGGDKMPLQTMDAPWSGYSSAATTPSSPSAGCKNSSFRYESNTARGEYDSYYDSWENACHPYVGYDVLPSKAFKTIAQWQKYGPTAAAVSRQAPTKFKCPKVSVAGENDP